VVCLFPVLLDDCSVSVLFSWAVSSKLLFIGASNLETRDMDFSGLEKLLWFALLYPKTILGFNYAAISTLAAFILWSAFLVNSIVGYLLLVESFLTIRKPNGNFLREEMNVYLRFYLKSWLLNADMCYKEWSLLLIHGAPSHVILVFEDGATRIVTTNCTLLKIQQRTFILSWTTDRIMSNTQGILVLQ
jgi:hypothetical protein